MKKKNNVAKGDVPRVLQNRSFRRWVKQMFAGWMKRQNGDPQDEVEKIILGRLQDIEHSIDVIVRQIQRQIKQAKRKP